MWPSRCCLLLLAIAAGSGFGLGADEPAKKPGKIKTVIPFDFESKFDHGVYGQTMGDMIWKKLERRAGFVIPESMLEVREWCWRHRFLPSPETPPSKMKSIVQKDQGGDIGIWGKIERVAGFDSDVYDLWIHIVDFSVEPAKTVYRKKVRTKTVSEIPHLYVKEALNALYGQGEKAVTRGPNPALIKDLWEKGPNLVQGTFEKGRLSPLGWDPLPKHVSWVHENAAKNRIIRFTIPAEVAETTGVLYYSAFFPVQEGATYRFQCRWRTTGTAVKVFIKCYDEFRTTSNGRKGSQRREVYRSQQNLAGPANTWNVHSEDFTPMHTQFTPRWGKVMLYGYYPAGRVDWRDVVLKQIVPAPSRAKEKIRRPSLESKVRGNSKATPLRNGYG